VGADVVVDAVVVAVVVAADAEDDVVVAADAVVVAVVVDADADEEVADLGAAGSVGGVSLAAGRVDETETGAVDGTICGGGSGTSRGTWGRYTTWVAATRPRLLA
jgi:hypothetical protein